MENYCKQSRLNSDNDFLNSLHEGKNITQALLLYFALVIAAEILL